MTIITLYALFADDIRVLVTDKYGDPKFYVSYCVCIGFFALEIILSSFAKEDYFNGFFFWLDIISTGSMFLDIGWLNIFQSNGSSKTQNAAQIARAARAGRIGTRAGRIVRIVRLIRLVKLYKHAQQALEQQALLQTEQEQPISARRQTVRPSIFQKESNQKSFLQNIESMKRNKQSVVAGVTPNNQNNKSIQNDEEAVRSRVNSFQRILEQRRASKISQQGIESQMLNPIHNGSKDYVIENPQVSNERARIGSQSFHKDSVFKVDYQKGQDSVNMTPMNQQSVNYKDSFHQNQNNSFGLTPANKVSDYQQNSQQLHNFSNFHKDGQKENTNLLASSKQQQEDSNPPAEHSNTNQKKQEKSDIDEDLKKETKVGQKLSDLTTRRVIMIVLAIMFSLPIFGPTTYAVDLTSSESGLYYIYKWYQQNNVNDRYVFQNILTSYTRKLNDPRIPLLYIGINYNYKTNSQMTTIFGNQTKYMKMRFEDILWATYQEKNDATMAAFDQSSDTHLNAVLSIIRTIFVSVVLTVGALYFSKDSNTLVIDPIQQMLKKVYEIGKNPLKAREIEESEALAKIIVEAKLKKQAEESEESSSKTGSNKNKKKKKKKKVENQEQMYETAILEKTIIKIGALLAIGFGEAGSEIIAKNMEKGGAVDPMIPGKKIIGIFGFCDIRNFTDTTEVLQQDVMLFVNEIAEIVHGTVDQLNGSANKNIGDAFLLVWKFFDEDIIKDAEGNLALSYTHKCRQIADLSLISFLKIMGYTYMSQILSKYKHHKALNERMPNYRVKQGFGLHVGWAIEGAIGSEFKIDASYLSPNVNMASRLEGATKQFCTPLLISGELYKCFTQKTQKQCRQIDRVLVKGKLQPLDIYACDVDFDNLERRIQVSVIDTVKVEKLSRNERKKLNFKKRLLKRIQLDNVKKNKVNIYDKYFNGDLELRAMREKYTPKFYQQFKNGFQDYLKGDWPNAIQKLEVCHELSPSGKDGPTTALVNVLKELGGVAPTDWPGYRELIEH